jgi:hypothetical protein
MSSYSATLIYCIADVVEGSMVLDIRLRLMLQCINGASSNPV